MDIARGYALVEEDDNAAAIEIPTNAVTVGNWHLHGASSNFGNHRLDLSPWSFPMGTNGASFSSFWYFVEGKLRPTPRDAAHEICAVGVPMLAMQGASCLWLSEGADDSRTIIWDNFFLNGDTNAPVTAQVTLWPSGDFATQSNNLRRVYARIDPRDWDGDGLANEIDPAPKSHDGDCFGTGVAWLNANCGNVLSATTNVLGEIETAWNDGVCTNAYYWLTFTSLADNNFISVTCDGESNLGNLAIVANSNQVCRVPLLMGAEYVVHADAPLADIAASDENAEIVYYDSPAALMNGAPQLRAGRPRLLAQGGGPSASFSVRSPLEFSFEPDGNGGYALSTSPRDVGAVLTGLTGACCLCALNESGFAWSCDAECRCAGSLHTLDGVATWEGYSRDWLSELRCPCATEGDDVNGAGVNMAFADAAVVFENAYTNAPGDVVARRSTTVTLGGRVVGGDFGGTLTVALSDGGRLVGTGGALPTNVAVPAGETYTFGIDYEGRTESASVGDITATATFTENMTGRILADATTLTSVRVELTPEYEINGLRNRHVAGVGEVLECRAHPQGISWNVVAVGEGKMATIGNKTVYFCPFKAEVNGLRVNVSGVEEGYVPLFQVVEPAGVLATRAIEIDYPEAISNHAGWVGMMLDLYIVPTNVCFGAISVVEVPEYGEGIAPTGYFTDEAFSEIWHHTELTRAGEWHEVRNDNFFMQDFAECRSGLPAGWRDGQITWRIPTAWGYVEEGEEVYTSAEFGEPYFQIFTLDTIGNFRVAKLGYWTERSPDGTRRRSENMEVQP